MTYSKSQMDAIAQHLRDRFVAGEVEGHEIVVALISMVKADRILLDDVAPILYTVYFGNPQGVMVALEKAHTLIDEEMIDSIIKEVNDK
ncbi:MULTISPECIES: hypothetical protein [unclassified Paenibacillus]|uniref:hypothetical protein n=1 Tax=unclassified Paenibacillus TaxID=185978 RepID=UPI00089C9C98|nr:MULTISPECIES: hypothetical protein [unclassified Paenibacillus]OMC68699.1 hypothetical protein BK126_12860 [Paenibacillus sp. FSL H7-0326]SDW54607.1 hypothetical protein SAMN05518848_102118 [Paenibacillus sp. PDC88]